MGGRRDGRIPAAEGWAVSRVERIGDCTLILGDCLEWMASVPPCFRVDAVITDPPYGVNLTAKVTKHNKIKASSTYEDNEDTILALVLSAHSMWTPIAKRAVVTPGVRLLQLYPRAKSIGTIFSPNGAGCDSWGFGCNNPILYYGTCPYLATGQGSRPNSFYSAHPGMHVTGENNIDHPCPKPIDWMLWLVTRGSLTGETVLDPFMGSGTTGVACVRRGRKFIGVEINEHYFNTACGRIEDAYRHPDMFIERPAPSVQEAMDI